jgi:acyl-CoA thioester hydrolase
MSSDNGIFECEIQARLRDVNLGGHVDNVEAIRVLDEARLLFCRFADLTGDGSAGLLRHVPAGIAELAGSQRVDYHAEMRFVPFQPFLVRMWVSHVGNSSFSVAYELRVRPGTAPAVVAETTLVLFDTAGGRSWPMTDAVRADLERHLGLPAGIRRG